MPACAATLDIQDLKVCRNVNMIWNTLVGEGLVRYGYRGEAAELVTRNMQAVI